MFTHTKVILNTIKISNLRNIESAEITLSPGTNIIHGENGAGKSTFLEAIYFLARAKSFRPGNSRSLVSQGQKQLNLYATASDQYKQKYRIGLQKLSRELSIRINGNAVKKLSVLAELLPITLITPQTYRIIEEGPEYRRRLLNWGVFHVEHSFNNIMTNFNRAMAQRNGALKVRNTKVRTWDSVYVEHAISVSQLQTAYVEKLTPIIFELTSDIDFLKRLEIEFYKGWPDEVDLMDALKGAYIQDCERGYTFSGPQRSDLVLKIAGQPVKNHLSRGQMKVLITAILISKNLLQKAISGDSPILLVDDLPAELDNSSLNMIAQMIKRMDGQHFITAVDQSKITSLTWSGSTQVFHVEHGAFTTGR